MIFKWRSTLKASDPFSTVGAEIWETNRRVRSHILSHTGSIPHLAVQLVLIDTVGSGRFRYVTSSTGKHEPVGIAVFFRIEKVGTKNELAS